MQEPEGAYPMQQQVRKPVTTEANSTRLMPPTASKLATSTHTALLQMVGGWPLDRSLPPQEPEEDNGHYYDHDESGYAPQLHRSPTPSSDMYPKGHTINQYDTHPERRNDDEDEGRRGAGACKKAE